MQARRRRRKTGFESQSASALGSHSISSHAEGVSGANRIRYQLLRLVGVGGWGGGDIQLLSSRQRAFQGKSSRFQLRSLKAQAAVFKQTLEIYRTECFIRKLPGANEQGSTAVRY